MGELYKRWYTFYFKHTTFYRLPVRLTYCSAHLFVYFLNPGLLLMQELDDRLVAMLERGFCSGRGWGRPKPFSILGLRLWFAESQSDSYVLII